MRTGRPKRPLELTDEDRDKLTTIALRPKSAQAMAMRARIVLSCVQGMSNSEVARKLHITGATVGKWRERFRESGMDGLLDEPRVGAPRRITDQQIEQVVTKTLESMPSNSTHWSTRLMAAEMGLSQNAIVRIWRAFGLQPHRIENFKFSKDPQFVEKMRDIVGLYLNPTDRAIVLCVDEKTQVQALNRTQQLLPPAPASRVSAVSQRHRRESPARLRRPPGDGQLRNSQGDQGASVVGAPPAVPRPFHADQRQLAESRGTIVCRSDGTMRPPRKSHSHSITGEGNARLLGSAQQRSKAVCLDGGCGSDLGQGSATF